MSNGPPICYGCAHRRDLVGNAHSECTIAGSAGMTFALAVIGRIEPPVFDPHGVRNGWCDWPVDFDPLWIRQCPHRAVIN